MNPDVLSNFYSFFFFIFQMTHLPSLAMTSWARISKTWTARIGSTPTSRPVLINGKIDACVLEAKRLWINGWRPKKTSSTASCRTLISTPSRMRLRRKREQEILTSFSRNTAGKTTFRRDIKQAEHTFLKLLK